MNLFQSIRKYKYHLERIDNILSADEIINVIVRLNSLKKIDITVMFFKDELIALMMG